LKFFPHAQKKLKNSPQKTCDVRKIKTKPFETDNMRTMTTRQSYSTTNTRDSSLKDMQQYASARKRVMLMVVCNCTILVVTAIVMAVIKNATVPRSVPQKQHLNASLLLNEQSAGLGCRIIVVETLRERQESAENGDDDDESSSMFIEEEQACIPINNGQEEDHTLLSLCESLQDILSLDSWKRHHDHEHQHGHDGILYVALSGVVVVPETRTVDVVSSNKETEQVTLVQQQQQQQQRPRRELYMGSLSLARIRVSTRDAEIATSAFEMIQQAFNSDVHIVSQYEAMSFGKLQIIPAGVFDMCILTLIYPTTRVVYKCMVTSKLQWHSSLAWMWPLI
jgi:hypothetical protein